MTGAVSGVPAEAIEASDREAMGEPPWLTTALEVAAGTIDLRAVDIPGLVGDMLKERTERAAALPALREGIAAEVLGPVRALLDEDRLHHFPDPHGGDDEAYIDPDDLRAALPAPVQAAEPTCSCAGLCGSHESDCGACEYCNPFTAAAPIQPPNVERIRAAIRLVQPDHLTPVGARIIEQALGGGPNE